MKAKTHTKSSNQHTCHRLHLLLLLPYRWYQLPNRLPQLPLVFVSHNATDVVEDVVCKEVVKPESGLATLITLPKGAAKPEAQGQVGGGAVGTGHH